MSSTPDPKLEIDFNPFEPAASGAPLGSGIILPESLEARVRELFLQHRTGLGPKAIAVKGEYGAGKSCLLEWLHQKLLPEHRIKSFYFDNPGVQFYDLANTLFRAIGRKNLAKSIWELAGSHMPTPYQGALFQRGFEEYLTSSVHPRKQQDIVEPLRHAVMKAGVTSDEEIAHRIARIVTDAVKKPYFEYRDFVPRQSGSLVAEGEEAPYFAAMLKTISSGSGADGIAFLVDEFEEIGLQRRLTKRAAHDYLATLRRLINLSRNGDSNFWIILSMTPGAHETTRQLDPALVDRMHEIPVNPLTSEDALTLIRGRMNAARTKGSRFTGEVFPFSEDLPFDQPTLTNPRRLVKVCFLALANAEESTKLPFANDYLKDIEASLYSLGDEDERPRDG